jgi:hypothetical protein
MLTTSTSDAMNCSVTGSLMRIQEHDTLLTSMLAGSVSLTLFVAPQEIACNMHLLQCNTAAAAMQAMTPVQLVGCAKLRHHHQAR